jgi:hypothetical protein
VSPRLGQSTRAIHHAQPPPSTIVNWRVEAFVDNVEDVVVPVGIGPSINQIPGLYSASLRPPRVYGVRMSFGF